MTKKRIFGYFIVFILLVVSIPVINLLFTKWREDVSPAKIPAGYVNDASYLNQTKIAKHIDVPKDKQAIIQQLSKLLKTAKDNRQKIAIAGAKHSMGGHTIYPDGIILNMLPYNHMSLNEKENILTVGSGALWSDIIAYLDKHGKSVAVMQALSSFSVGGSISVNGHGWQKNSPPVSSSVITFTLMDHNGDIITCSRDENAELFRLVIGGYGLLGIILDVKLGVVDNVALRYKNFVMPSNQYLDYYQQYVTDNAQVNLVYGRLNVAANRFLDEATLNIYEQVSNKIPAFDAAKTHEIQRLVLRSSVNSEYGKRQRW
ncbi:MAG: FAD-binding oxidoreductase, partial [Acidobacteria bacterium]